MSRMWRFNGKALSISQPWAAAVAYLGKDIENKPMRTHFRGPIAIHASRRCWWEDLDLFKTLKTGGPRRRLSDWIHRRQKWYGMDVGRECEIRRGCVLAIAMLVDCVETSSSRWFNGKFGWVLQSVIPIEPVPMNGALGLWNCKFSYRPLVPLLRRHT